MAKKNLFTQVEMTHLKSNVFDLSHDVKLSLKMGDLVPIMCTEVIPGDKFTIGCESLLRFAPLVAPVMHRMDVTMHYFFVPNRLVWKDWEKYITGVSGYENSFPYITIDGGSAIANKLMNYFGIPFKSGDPTTHNISAIPFGAYQCIYDNYYRDQNIIPSAFTDPVNDGYVTNGGNGDANLWTMRKRAWEHDYFTSCLPGAQYGSAPVTLPISGDVVLKDTTGITPKMRNSSAHATIAGDVTADVDGDLQTNLTDSVLDPNGSLEVTSTNTTISDLRRAFRLQEFLEKQIRGGSRYIEFILSMFGVRSSDKRLQRPEYITGVKSPVVISEVLNTTGTVDAPQGNMAGHGVAVTSGKYGSYYAEEHGYIIGIMSVIPKTAYQDGLPKHFTKVNNRYEFYFEQFAHIGEQPVLNKEVKAFEDEPDETFGYIPRYSEYKFQNNMTNGDFRTTLDFWTLTRQFATKPLLNADFINCTPDTRIFAVEDGTDYLWAQVYNSVKAVRKMPYFGSPRF